MVITCANITGTITRTIIGDIVTTIATIATRTVITDTPVAPVSDSVFNSTKLLESRIL
jgi:hypothetical protein